jgi:transcriptional regulator with XRE-family HTH domain
MSLGPFLRDLRKTRHLTLEAVSQRAGIARVTLNRWEKGTHQPRLAELDAVLGVLEASPRQRKQALNLLDAPRARNLVRDEINRIAERRNLGPMPQGGDLLRTMRHRRRLSQEALAKQIGVSARTLHRWERSEAWPTMEQLHAFCFAVGAHEEEVIGLTVGRFAPDTPPEHRSLEAIAYRLQQVRMLEFSGSHIEEELGYLSLEKEAWSLALRQSEGQTLLAHICSAYALFLQRFRRFNESTDYAGRALDLYPQKASVPLSQINSGILATICPIQQWKRPMKKRELNELRFWLSQTEQEAQAAWIHSMIAVGFAEEGAYEEALQVNAMALQLAKRSQYPLSVYVRQCDHACYLVALGHYEQALEWMVFEEEVPPFNRIPGNIIRASAYLGLNQRSEAYSYLQQIYTDIATHDLGVWREEADTLAAQL